MRTLSVAVIMIVMLGVGVYIGISGIATQLSVDLDLSRGSATDAVCAPDRAIANTREAVYFAVAGIDDFLPYSWSSGEGRTERLDDGRLWASFETAGRKTVSAFIAGTGGQWRRITCSVQIQ